MNLGAWLAVAGRWGCLLYQRAPRWTGPAGSNEPQRAENKPPGFLWDPSEGSTTHLHRATGGMVPAQEPLGSKACCTWEVALCVRALQYLKPRITRVWNFLYREPEKAFGDRQSEAGCPVLSDVAMAFKSRIKSAIRKACSFLLCWNPVFPCPNDEGYWMVFVFLMYKKPKSLRGPKICRADQSQLQQNKGPNGKKWHGKILKNTENMKKKMSKAVSEPQGGWHRDKCLWRGWGQPHRAKRRDNSR